MRPGHQQEFSCCLLLLAMNAWKAAWNQGWPHKWQSGRAAEDSSSRIYTAHTVAVQAARRDTICKSHVFVTLSRYDKKAILVAVKIASKTILGMTGFRFLVWRLMWLQTQKRSIAQQNFREKIPKWKSSLKKSPWGPCSHHHHGCVRILPQAWAASPARVASHPQKGDPPAKFCRSLEQGGFDVWLTCKKD